jgi:hypothetical protein
MCYFSLCLPYREIKGLEKQRKCGQKIGEEEADGNRKKNKENESNMGSTDCGFDFEKFHF